MHAKIRTHTEESLTSHKDSTATINTSLLSMAALLLLLEHKTECYHTRELAS